jgi:serine/threonine protein kinase
MAHEVERLLNCEWVESYRPGGFHPVDIDDTFQAERYEIVRKLGHGSSSTVWLAQDTR